MGLAYPVPAQRRSVLLGLWIRNGIDETPDFIEARSTGDVARIPIVDTFRYHWREVLIATGAKVVETAPFYLFTTFSVGLRDRHLEAGEVTILNAVTIASVVTVCAIPLMGALSDRIGRKRLFLIGSLLMGAFAFPYFYLLDQKTTSAVVTATVVAVGLIWAPIVATLAP